MLGLAGMVVGSLIDPIKWIIAFVIYRKDPHWGVVVAVGVATGVVMAVAAEAMAVGPTVWDLLLVPGIIASLLLFSLAKLIASSRKKSPPDLG